MMQTKIVALALALVCLTQSSALASDPKREVAQALHQFGVALAGNDGKAIIASCAPAATVIDEFSPFAWTGNGCASWWTALQALTKKYGIKDLHIAASLPRLIYVEGSRAYAVIPSRVTSVHKAGDYVWENLYATVILQHLAGGWKIVNLSWTTAAQGSSR